MLTPPDHCTTQVTLRKGESYTLRCSAQGQPNPRVTWSRQGLSLSPGLSLQLSEVDRTSEGEYVCTAANGVGQPAVTTVRVAVLCK